MAYSLNRLPSRFPVGTKFVIEARRSRKGEAQVFSRHLEFPDGTRVALPARKARVKAQPAGRRAGHSRMRSH